LKQSIRYSLDHRDEALSYALNYARDMDRGLADRFVGMYVNDWTLDYGERGREAVRRLLDEGHRAGIIPAPVAVEVVGGPRAAFPPERGPAQWTGRSPWEVPLHARCPVALAAPPGRRARPAPRPPGARARALFRPACRPRLPGQPPRRRRPA